MIGLTGLWIENQDKKHFFTNINFTKSWTEYVDNKPSSGYRLHKYDGKNLILENRKSNSDSYVILTPTGYYSNMSFNSLDDFKNPLIIGSWYKKT